MIIISDDEVLPTNTLLINLNEMFSLVDIQKSSLVKVNYVLVTKVTSFRSLLYYVKASLGFRSTEQPSYIS